jgi:hypothetical protein
VTQLETAIHDTSAAAITYQSYALKKTFTEQYGASFAQTMYNLCNVVDDDHLPEAHRLLAQSPKGQAYAILGSYAKERAYTLDVPLTAGCLPLATTKMTDQVFRSFKPACTCVAFGEGLPPFACVCEGHAQSQTVQLMIKKAEVAKSSATLSLTNAERLTSMDVQFPTTPQTAIEKLYAWSIYIDRFHGSTHPVAANGHEFVKAVGPGLHVIFS